MGFLKTMKRLLTGHDITGGANAQPMNRQERREEERRLRRLKKKEKVTLHG